MTPNSYEELEARLRLKEKLIWAGSNAYSSVPDEEGIEIADALADLRKQRDDMKQLTDTLWAQRDEAHNAIAWANNSLFGSHGFFLSLDGGPADEHHLDTAIEKLKARSNREWRRAEAAKAEAERLRKVAEGERARCIDRLRKLQDGLDRTHTGPHGTLAAAIEALIALPPLNLSSKED